MKSGVQVGDLMTRNFIHTSEETNLKECSKFMVKKKVGSLIICGKDKKLRGILTEKDILWAIVKKSKKDLDKILAKDLMKRKVVTIKPSADMVDALQKMKKKKVRRLPVIENKKVIGMLTIKDLLRIDPGLFEFIAETQKIREETEKLKKRGLQEKEGICEECNQPGNLYLDTGVWVCDECYNK